MFTSTRSSFPKALRCSTSRSAIEGAGLGPAQDFLKVAQSDSELIAELPPGAPSIEGYLFPDTYEFSRMQTMHDMAAAMVKQFREVAHQMGLITSTDGGVVGRYPLTPLTARRPP
jgi:UPF0755 protein